MKIRNSEAVSVFMKLVKMQMCETATNRIGIKSKMLLYKKAI